MKVAPDTSVISLFSEIGRIHLLLRILSDQTIILTQHVVDEIADGYTHGYDFYKDIMALIKPTEEIDVETASIHIINVDNDRVVQFSRDNGLGHGESSVILTCRGNLMDTAGVLDDGRARKIAKENGVRFTGTLGLVKRGFEICKTKDKALLMNVLTEIGSTDSIYGHG